MQEKYLLSFKTNLRLKNRWCNCALIFHVRIISYIIDMCKVSNASYRIVLVFFFSRYYIRYYANLLFNFLFILHYNKKCHIVKFQQKNLLISLVKLDEFIYILSKNSP